MTASPADYSPTPRTTPTRNSDRAGYDRTLVHEILDAEYLCHVGFVADTAPVVLPTLFARVDDRLYLHGSSGSRLMLLAREGVPVCVTVTCLDGLVLARSAMHHSVNYRSVVAHGTAYRVTDERESRLALDRIVDHVVPGRAADIRPPSAKELAATGVLRLDLAEVSAKVRSGGVDDDPEDVHLPHWAGVLPVRRAVGAPEPDPRMPDEAVLPAYLEQYSTR
ncbi:hypothetical protein F4561_000476 [Lipingzhangella halophila]|uniref:Pyridoxamine 5'-phosphate oxidase family protein n=1 Tax=Lipingzhangella halophila TaxID=1783352 RepID=A0A7W7W0I0_9ACTN|nr:pyridoxamine 5'-phosphate oxidase family protein [Lipingzhangella halophila]MBB4929656.1 hypothetical protein [Lipingzhangella halophila]